jgi:hypothetical protein
LCCCGLGGFVLSQVTDLLHEVQQAILEEQRVINLGIATAPPSASVDGGAWYQWKANPLSPPGREAGYALAAEEAAAVLAAEKRIARELGYRHLDGGTFSLLVTRTCRADIACAYRKIAENDAKDVAPLTRLFLEHGKDAGLDQGELAALIVTFVQNLRYDRPDASVPFGIFPPALVASEGWGDCDSKGLLAVMMLEGAGIDAVLLSSEQFTHAAVGVMLPGEGMRVPGDGRSYLYWEVTTPNWPPGDIKPELNKPQMWRAISLAAPPPVPPRTRSPQ